MGKSGSESFASQKGLSPGVVDVTVDNRGSVAVDCGGALQEGDWTERNVVGVAPNRALH